MNLENVEEKSYKLEQYEIKKDDIEEHTMEEFPTDDEDLLERGSGYSMRHDNFEEKERSYNFQTELPDAQSDEEVDTEDDDELTIFGIKLPSWLHIGSKSTSSPRTTVDAHNATTFQPTTTTTTSPTTTAPTTPRATETTTKSTTKKVESINVKKQEIDDITHKSSVDILSYFKGNHCINSV